MTWERTGSRKWVSPGRPRRASQHIFIKPRNNDISIVILNLPIYQTVTSLFIPVLQTILFTVVNAFCRCCSAALMKQTKRNTGSNFPALSVKMLLSFTKSSEPFMCSSKLSCRPRSQLSQSNTSADRGRLPITSTE